MADLRQINGTYQADAVEILEEALAKAKAGEVLHAFIILDCGGELQLKTTRVKDTAGALGRLRMLEHTILEQW